MKWEFTFPASAVNRAQFHEVRGIVSVRTVSSRTAIGGAMVVMIEASNFSDACETMNRCVEWAVMPEALLTSSG